MRTPWGRRPNGGQDNPDNPDESALQSHTVNREADEESSTKPPRRLRVPLGRASRRRPGSAPRVITPALGTFGPVKPSRRTYATGFMGVCALSGALVAGIALPVVGTGAMTAKHFAQDFQALPSDLETRPPAQASVLLASDGTRIATFFDENRVNVPLDHIAPIMKQAILAIEDYRFYEHGGIDLKGTARAFVNNRGDNSTQGGSTLTQQYVKNLLIQLSDGDPDKIAAARAHTVKRKVQELKYALEIEKKMPKDQILDNYLNISYFGSGSYGIEAASRHYFSKSSNNLTLTEASLLAGIVRSPSAYDPIQHPDAAKDRRDVVLNRMRELNYITVDQLNKAKAEDLGLRPSANSNGCTTSPVPFFCDYITHVILNDPVFGQSEQERADLLSRGGLTIRTTLDMKAQRATDQAIQDKTDPTDKVAAALASVEPGTGKIRAMGVSREYGTGKGKTVINYATDYAYGGSRGFQDGSTHKVFTTAAALAEGYGSEYKIDSPYSIGGFHADRNCQGKRVPADGWHPKNFTDDQTNGVFGVITMREGLRRSVNSFFAQMEQKVGLCDVVQMATAAGIHRADGKPQHEFLPYTLGINEVSPLTVADSYATMAARGVHCDPIAIESMIGRDGKPLPVPSANCKQAIDPKVADATVDIMRSVMEKGGYGYPMDLNDNRQAGGKTGTTNNNIAVWYSGITPQLATSVWVGNPDDYNYKMGDMTIGGTFYHLVVGSKVPGPIWKEMMDAALAGAPKLQFHPADAATLHGTQGSGDSGTGKMTYKYSDLALPKIGDSGDTSVKVKSSKKSKKNAAPTDTTASTPVTTQSKQR
ncbi:MAG TPA: transglycosylase domain-containing protein [Sporichthyaceae bacterium]|nr:transglycosylase domain-containing protein [Sporichthyaceae bacterium]